MSKTSKIKNSLESVEDNAFDNLIKRWTAARDWNKVQLAFMTYGLALEERTHV